MHPNPSFRGVDEAALLAFVRARSFGMLTVAHPTEPTAPPLAAHIPFRVMALDRDPGDIAQDGTAPLAVEFHLVRSNPIARALAQDAAEARPLGALIAVSGPDAYVSPDWYGLGPDQVPTWNYVAAHLRGSIALLPPERLRPHLDAVSAAFEGRLAPKPPWTLDKTSPGFFEKLARQIVPAQMRVEQLDGTWKLNQNKPLEAQRSAAAGIESAGVGSSAAIEIATLMRSALDDP